jgi:hypothetical protein
MWLLFSLTFNLVFKYNLGPDPDTDSHESAFILKLDPDPHKVNADPKYGFSSNNDTLFGVSHVLYVKVSRKIDHGQFLE